MATSSPLDFKRRLKGDYLCYCQQHTSQSTEKSNTFSKPLFSKHPTEAANERWKSATEINEALGDAASLQQASCPTYGEVEHLPLGSWRRSGSPLSATTPRSRRKWISQSGGEVRLCVPVQGGERLPWMSAVWNTQKCLRCSHEWKKTCWSSTDRQRRGI